MAKINIQSPTVDSLIGKKAYLVMCLALVAREMVKPEDIDANLDMVNDLRRNLGLKASKYGMTREEMIDEGVSIFQEILGV